MKNRETPTIPSLTFYRAGLAQGFTDGKSEIQTHEILTGKRAEYQLGYLNGFKLGQEILKEKNK